MLGTLLLKQLRSAVLTAYCPLPTAYCSSVRRHGLVRVVAAGGERGAVVAVAELGLGAVERVDVEAVGVEVGGQVVRRAQEDGGRVARVGADFQQALDHLKRGENSHRVSVGCHLASRASSRPSVFDA